MSAVALRRSVTLAGAALILMIIADGCYEALQDYRAAVIQSELAIGALSRALAEQATRMIQDADFVLADFAEWNSTPAGQTAGPETMRSRLRATATRLPFIVSARVVGANGQVRTTTRDGAPSDGDWSGQELFSGPQNIEGGGLYVSAPRVGRRDGYLTFALSRAIRDATGHFSGVVAVRISFDYLRKFYAAVDVVPGASIRLERDDGVVLARYSADAANAGPDPFGSYSVATGGGDRIRRVVSADGRSGMISTRKVDGYKISIEIVQPMSSALATWRSQELASAVRTGILALLAFMLLVALDRALRRRERSEHLRVRLEKQLHATERAETLGMFAACIAHDFNNVLAAIIGYAELARSKVPDDAPAARNLQGLLAAGERARSLVQRVLTFDSKRGVRKANISLEPIINEVLDQVRATLPEGISVQASGMGESDRTIRGDSTEVHQAIMNLCSNAVHAMTHGGLIELRLETVHFKEEQQAAVGRLLPGEWLCLTVNDQGTGMTSDKRDAIFAPFFSTKDRGNGTGLGLAVVRNIVISMGGAVKVDSIAAVGTSFRVYWPLASPAPMDTSRDRSAPLPGNGQTIMVIDDEASLVVVAEELLASLGYEAVGFTDAQQALQALQRNPSRFDAIISDERMPSLRGSDVALVAHDLCENLPIVIVTGHRDAGLTARAQAAGVAQILDKPLRIEQLERVLAEVLRRST